MLGFHDTIRLIWTIHPPSCLMIGPVMRHHSVYSCLICTGFMSGAVLRGHEDAPTKGSGRRSARNVLCCVVGRERWTKLDRRRVRPVVLRRHRERNHRASAPFCAESPGLDDDAAYVPLRHHLFRECFRETFKCCASHGSIIVKHNSVHT